MKYAIKSYRLYAKNNAYVLESGQFAATLKNSKLVQLLMELNYQKRKEISQEALESMANCAAIPVEKLTALLINQLKILKPLYKEKLKKIYINGDMHHTVSMLEQSFPDYEVTSNQDIQYNNDEFALLLFFRKNYSSKDFKILFNKLPDKLYIITAGVAHNVLIIDNLYYKDSGLPGHFSNINHLYELVHSQVPMSSSNWICYFRSMMQKGSERFPDPIINSCQEGYIAYCLYRFSQQFTSLWDGVVTMDQLNWYWHVDLADFSINKDVAIHSPFAKEDMGVGLIQTAYEESV